MIIEKLPLDTRKRFEESMENNRKIPKTSDVIDRIQASLRTLELLNVDAKQQEKGSSKALQSKQTEKAIKSFASTKQPESNFDTNPKTGKSSQQSCVLCTKPHSIRPCPDFLKKAVCERSQTAKDKNLCYNCLLSIQSYDRSMSQH